MPNGPKGYDSRVTLVYIDSYENGVPTGCFYNPSLAKWGTFQSLSQFLLKLDELLNEAKAPQSFTSARTFRPMIHLWPEGAPDTTGQGAGRQATFALRILFRQNASWQGTVDWLERAEKLNFRSVLELIGLIARVLNKQNDETTKPPGALSSG